jgi:protoporphyrinogen oxidase
MPKQKDFRDMVIKYLILGAGPSGLAFAHTLKKMGENSYLLIEAEKEPGGLCRSTQVDGAPIDIGGGHFLDVKMDGVLKFLFEFMPREEWNEYSRISTILLRGKEIDYPIEANLWQLPISDQIDYLESIAKAGCVRGEPMPKSFEAWIEWKLGGAIAREYMLPYNHKIWTIPLNELGTYWLYKLPDVSFRDVLKSCLTSKPSGSLPAHARFFYPKKYGYGEVWRRMGAALGDKLLTSTPVTNIDLKNKLVNGSYQAKTIVTTIPWSIWPKISNVPHEIFKQIQKLRFASIDVDYYSQTVPTNAHWVYDPDDSKAYHRILCRRNFCQGSRGYWTEANAKRENTISEYKHRNEYAYPLNTIDKPKTIKKVLNWANRQGILGIGRWGKWEHMNSDVAVAEGMAAAETVLKKRG